MMMRVLLLSFGIFASFGIAVIEAQAATYVMQRQAVYTGCLRGSWPGCLEPEYNDRAYVTSGTVTVPDSVPAGTSYPVVITQRLLGSGLTQCRDTATSPRVPCSASQITTIGYSNLPAPNPNALAFGQRVPDWNTLPWRNSNGLGGVDQAQAGYFGAVPSGNTSGTLTRTAPTTGTTDTLAILQIVDARFAVTCTDGCITYPYAYYSIPVNVLPTTTCSFACGGTIQYSATTTTPVNDFSCGAGQRLTTTGGSWTGAQSCQGRFITNNGAGRMNCVADPACVSSCTWVSTGYVNGRGNPPASTLHNSAYCRTPRPSDGTPDDSMCTSSTPGRSTVCCDSGADCYRYSCQCGAVGVPSVILTPGVTDAPGGNRN